MSTVPVLVLVTVVENQTKVESEANEKKKQQQKSRLFLRLNGGPTRWQPLMLQILRKKSKVE
ncbi:hypothetical protein TYRP_006559 [Tyrophagus putrescentiae]|nr:hypothetical protein TYRP_006559 [Tyrophagus putrescentiae]